MAAEWRIIGKVVVACNCDWGCPCNFNARPTTGKCEGGWTWSVEEGGFGDVDLAGLIFSVFVNWPGAIHDGGGTALILIDERADDRQREAIETLVGGSVGGPWGILAWTWPTSETRSARYEIEVDEIDGSHVRVDGVLELETQPIRNPVTGNESFPGVVLPQGIIFKRGDLGASKTFRVRDGIAYDHSGQYLGVGDFEYSGP